MKPIKSFRYALRMVLHSRLRSWLTILGIVIGVGSVIAINSLGEGLQSQIASRLSGLGGDIITISPGAPRPTSGGMGGGRGGEAPPAPGSSSATSKTITLDKGDLQVVRSIPEILYVDPQIRGSVNVSYLGKAGKVTLTGVDQAVWGKVTTATLEQGRFLDAADQNVVVIGSRLANDYFSQPLGINKMLTIEDRPFRIVGILEEQSTSVYMPYTAAVTIIEDKTMGEYDQFVVKVRDQDQLDYDLAVLRDRLQLYRHVTNTTQDFSVTSTKQMQETFSATMSTMTTFLLAIAGVSLLVGAVGIANTMFTSVLEKTKQIGIMKAIGARNEDILMIFLWNAAIIGLIGGIIGIILGALLSYLLPSLLGNALPMTRGGMLTVVSAKSLLMAVGISCGVGIIAGLVPAWQASKLKPVDALRFE